MTFDPSKTTEHTVPEVVDAVTEHPGLAADVLAAERSRTDREPRATLIEKVEALQAAESTTEPADGDSAPDADSAAQTQPEPASVDGGVPDVNMTQTPAPALTGDGTPRDTDDGAAASRITPDVPAVDFTQDSIMAGDPMTDANRGSAPVTTSSEQPGAVIAE